MSDSIENSIGQLEHAFPGRVTTPNSSAAYEAAVTKPWSQTCWTIATAYVSLNSAEEVAEALKIVKATKCKFAVRTTGHNPNPGFSSIDGPGVVLDLRQLRSKALDSNDIAQIGAGNTWGEVYTWLEERKLSAIGGRDKQVGVAGFLLGGGMGAFPNLHGLGTDGVHNFQVALADGTLVNANNDENKDLFVALKGGGSNFGVVTRFDLRTHPLINVKYTINVYSPADYTAINKATVDVQEAMESDPKIGLFTNFNPNFVAVGLLYADHQEPASTAFEPFKRVQSLMATAVPNTSGTLLSLAQAMGHEEESKNRAICTVTTRISHTLYDKVHLKWKEIRETLPEGAVLHYTIQPVGTDAVNIGISQGGNCLGLENVSQCWWVFTCEWPRGACDDSAAYKAVDQMAHAVEQLAHEEKLLLDFLCMSFATGSQKVLRSYGGTNVLHMQQVAKKYDNEGVFQNLQNGGFLLRNSV